MHNHVPVHNHQHTNNKKTTTAIFKKRTFHVPVHNHQHTNNKKTTTAVFKKRMCFADLVLNNYHVPGFVIKKMLWIFTSDLFILSHLVECIWSAALLH